MNDNEFEIILDNDEQIIKTIKPNKTRFVTINIVFSLLIFIILGVVLIATGIATKNDPDVGQGNLVGLTTIGSILLFFGLVMSLSSFVTYKKTNYAITNKRVIIKSGFIGSDFKSLDLNTIGAISVRVDFLDKLIRPINTGSIDFGSMSMPMGAGESGKGGNAFFSFKHIDNPYVLYKEIKQYINDAKAK